MNAKENFLRDKDLVKWWVSITHDPRYDAVVTHARSMIMESAMERAEMVGARHILGVLETMAETPDKAFEFPSPGVIHNVDKMPDPPVEEQKPPPPDPPMKRTNKKRQ